MSNYRARAMEEFGELGRKIEKLKAFVISKTYDDLPEIERTALKDQLGHMEAYHSVLHGRVSRMCT